MQNSVNRHLGSGIIDHVDHALGRPEHPMDETYRNYFECATMLEANELKETGWFECKGLMCTVTLKGCRALRSHLLRMEPTQ